MTILNRYKRLVSSVFKSRVLLEQTGVFRGVRSGPKAQCPNLCLPRQLIANVASCHDWGQVFTCHLDTKRRYSEVYSGNNNSQKCEEESRDMDSDSLKSK